MKALLAKEALSLLRYLAISVSALTLVACSTPMLSYDQPFIRSQDTAGRLQNIPIDVNYPTEAIAPYPVVIDMHGCSGIVKARQEDWVLRLNQWGYAVIKPDSFTVRGDSNICDEVFKISPLHRLNDIAGAIEYAIADPKVDANNLFVMGMSHGGTTVLLTHYQPHHNFNYIKGVIAYYPYCIETMPALISDTLVLIGEEDDWTPAKNCQDMSIVNRNGYDFQLVVYPGVVHSFDIPNVDVTYYGHRLRYDQDAALDSFTRVHHFLQTRTE